MGFGSGAASLMENCRFVRDGKIEGYEKGLRRNLQQLSLSDRMEEFMFLGLRMTAGVSVQEFENCFQVPMEEIYGEVLEKLEKKGLLARQESRIFLTKQGIDVSNPVLAEFLL